MDMRDQLTTVNGKPVTVEDVFVYLKATGSFRDAIYSVIEIEVIKQQAQAFGFSVSKAELQEHSDSKRRWLGLTNALDWHSHCRWVGITLDQWNKVVRTEVLRKKLQRRVISAADIKRYFESNRSELMTTRLSRIICVAETVIKELLEQLRSRPDDFPVIARQHSIEEQTRHAGGYLGSVSRGILPAEIERAVFAAQPAEVLGPFREKDHWTLYRVDGFDRSELDDANRAYISEKLFSDWLRRQVSSAKA